MKANEIRAINEDSLSTIFLQEIAAQLADLNESRRAAIDTVASKLRACGHRRISIVTEPTELQFCFDCGSTRRDTKQEWSAPWIWRQQ